MASTSLSGGQDREVTRRYTAGQMCERVRAALRDLGLNAEVVTFKASTRTAADAANAIGCEPKQVVKSLVFMAGGQPVMALVPGDRSASPPKLARLLGLPRKQVRMATAGEIREHTGYDLGTVTPVGLPGRMDIAVDTVLRDCNELWLAAGEERAMFRANTDDLVRAIGAQWAEISERPDL